MFPNADVIAVAIYAAARAVVPATKLYATVLQVTHGARDMGARVGYAGGFPIARARIYAAVALWDAYPEASRPKIGKCLGQHNPASWSSKLDKDLQRGLMKWWDDDIECAVRAAVVWAMAKENPAPMVERGDSHQVTL